MSTQRQRTKVLPLFALFQGLEYIGEKQFYEKIKKAKHNLKMPKFKFEQGKKVCKATAVRCAHLLALRRSDANWSPAEKLQW